MRSIQIVQTPLGEAPLAVRQAWIGLILPLAEDVQQDSLRRRPSFGVLSGPKRWWQQLLALLRGGVESVEGYVVDAPTAIECLAHQAPAAAQWWRERAPISCAAGSI
jgi:hypothetical protein